MDWKIRDISELEDLMTDEQKAKAKTDFDRFHPEGTPVVMCTSPDDGVNYLKPVNLEDFDVEVMPDGLKVLSVDADSTRKLEDHLFATDPLLRDLEAIRDVEGYTEFPDLDKKDL